VAGPCPVKTRAARCSLRNHQGQSDAAALNAASGSSSEHLVVTAANRSNRPPLSSASPSCSAGDRLVVSAAAAEGFSIASAEPKKCLLMARPSMTPPVTPCTPCAKLVLKPTPPAVAGCAPNRPPGKPPALCWHAARALQFVDTGLKPIQQVFLDENRLGQIPGRRGTTADEIADQCLGACVSRHVLRFPPATCVGTSPRSSSVLEHACASTSWPILGSSHARSHSINLSAHIIRMFLYFSSIIPNSDGDAR
jgi:hypothetical protein